MISSEDFSDCWEDDSRMTTLFAPFRDRSLNPQGWESKFLFWSAMIAKWCERKGRVTFTLEELNKDFMRNGRVPECLPTVVTELQNSKSILQPPDFMKIYSISDTWRGWMFDVVVKKPFSWTFDKMKGIVISPTITTQTQFIHLPALQRLSDVIVSSAGEDLQGELMDLETLLSGCKISNLPSLDAVAVAHYLSYLGYAAVIDQSCNKDVHQIQLKLRGASSKQRPTITDVDRGIYRLRSNEKVLLHYLEKLENERKESIDQAKSYLAKGMRSTAKSCLRKKRELEKVIDKRSNALENIQVLLSKIRDASSDQQVLESYRAGLSALKQTFKAAGLTEDDAANTMDDVKEVLDTHNEIQAILAEPVDSVTDEGLEEELSNLLSQENALGPGAGAGTGGNLDSSDTDLQERLLQLRMNDSIPPSTESNLLPATPKAVTLQDLPGTPSSIISPGNLTPL